MLVFLLLFVWTWRTLMFQLLGFYCMEPSKEGGSTGGVKSKNNKYRQGIFTTKTCVILCGCMSLDSWS